MNTIKLSSKEKRRHLAVWFLITIFLCILDPPPSDKNIWLSILEIVITMLSYAFVYYSHFLYIFPKFAGKNIRKLISVSFAVLFSFLIINYFDEYYISTLLGDSSSFSGEPYYNLASLLLIFFFIITTMALGGFQTKQSILRMETEYEQERVLITKSLGFFQNQFNSHITFNMLNYCYRHFLDESEKGAEAIELFSTMLRHSLTNKANEAIALADEVQHISNYIALHKQLNEEMHVNIEIKGNLTGLRIFPRILLTFIENAIKHGDLYSKDQPILIRLSVTENSIDLLVANKKQEPFNSITKRKGIGYLNVTQQLDLFYKSKYSLKISENKENYTCELNLKHT